MTLSALLLSFSLLIQPQPGDTAADPGGEPAAVMSPAVAEPQGGNLPEPPTIAPVGLSAEVGGEPAGDFSSPGGEPSDDMIVVTAEPDAARVDPLRPVNAKSFEVVQSVDKAVVGPVARTYKKIIPKPVRGGVRNLLANLQEPVVFLNYMLQLKPGKGLETLGRFAINSTAGLGGLIDVAKTRPFKLPRRANGFGNTLGYYGVKPGAYLYLPLIGPTTVRDLGGRVLDLSALPLAIGKPFDDPAFTVPATAVRLVDERAEADACARASLGEADAYAVVRDNYLRRREAEIAALRHPSSPAADRFVVGTGCGS